MWMYNLHSEVNRMLGKDAGPSFETVRDMYETFRARCGNVAHGVENGCTSPVSTVKTKCLISIVPQTRCSETVGSIHVDHDCYLDGPPWDDYMSVSMSDEDS